METACHMAGVEMADALVPQVAHLMLGNAPEVGQVDAQALWVILMDTWEDFGLEPWM